MSARPTPTFNPAAAADGGEKAREATARTMRTGSARRRGGLIGCNLVRAQPRRKREPTGFRATIPMGERPPGYAAAAMPPTPRPFPAFIADAPQEGDPYGRWSERLVEEFAVACEPLADEAGAPLDREAIKWFPEPAWGGRGYPPLAR